VISDPSRVGTETESSSFLHSAGERFVSIRQQIVSSSWNAVRTAFTVALFLIGAYLIDNRQNVYVGLLLVGWSFARVSTYVQRVYRLSVGRSLLDAVSEVRANTRLEIFVNVGAILEHPAANSAFERLQRINKIPTDATFTSWRDGLLNRFRERAAVEPKHDAWAKVVFEVRSGQLWKDGEYRRSPVMFQEILIPDEALKRKYSFSDDEDRQYYGIRVRITVINGLLKVQLGEWDEETGHREAGQQYSWIAWDTITTFPLLLNPLDHYLPPRFLLFDYFSRPHHRRNWGGAKKAFFRQADEYRRVLSTFGEYGENRLYERQSKEFERWLQREGFKRTWGDEPPVAPSWTNRYVRIDIGAAVVDFDTYKWLSEEGEKVY
jgi:hypothetical protein